MDSAKKEVKEIFETKERLVRGLEVAMAILFFCAVRVLIHRLVYGG